MTTTGYPGHLLPLLPFAHALARAGDEVCVAGPATRGGLVRDAGLEFVGCADPPAEEVGQVIASAARLPRQQGHARIIADGFGRVGARAMLPDLLQIIGAWQPDVVVRESQEFAAALAAEHHGTPHVRVGLGLASTERQTISLTAGALDDLRAEHGLPADPHGERIHASPYLTQVPSELEHPQVAAAPATHRFKEAHQPTAQLPDWWPGSADPLVYVTFGSVAGSMGFFPELYRATIEALAGLRVRVLVTTGTDADPAALRPLASHIHVERWVAQELIAPHAAAIVSHGGYGTTLQALAHGVPLVLLPLFADDQRQIARRVAEISVGIALDDTPGTEPTMFEHPHPEVLSGLTPAVRRVLEDPQYRHAAAHAADAIRALPAVDAAADVLRAIATTSSRTGRRRGVPRRRAALTPEKITAARAMREREHTMPEIARALGVSRATLYRHLHAAPFPLPRGISKPRGGAQ